MVLQERRRTFAERYIQAMLPKHADVSMHMHARNEMASPVTPVNGSAFAVVHQAIQETLAGGRVTSFSVPSPLSRENPCSVAKLSWKPVM